MTNHPNRGWRSRWSVDLEAATATHRDGWVFRFAPAPGNPGAFDGQCIGRPDPLLPRQVAQAARIAREAGEIYIEARGGGKRPPGRPLSVRGRRVNVYLDAASMAGAAALGGGNVSEGIRRAIRAAVTDSQSKRSE